MSVLLTLALAASAAPPQGAGLDPVQILTTTDTTSPDPIGDQAAVDGDTAIVLGGPPRLLAPSAPLRVLFFERDATGRWSESQAVELPLGTNPLGDGSVDLDGDVATVFVRRRDTVGAIPDLLYFLERDAQGIWSWTHRLTSGFPGTDLAAARFAQVAGDDVLVLEQTVRGARVFRRTAGPGSWTEVQDFGFPPSFVSVLDFDAEGDLAVIPGDLSGVLVAERDGAGTWSVVTTLPGPAAPESYRFTAATDGERLALLRTDAFGLPAAVDVFVRTDPSQPASWALEDVIDPEQALAVGIIPGQPFPALPTGYHQRIHLAGDTVVLRTRGGCGPSSGAFVQTARRSGSSWFVDPAVCALPVTGETQSRVLAFDGETLLVGEREAFGVGAVAFAPILNADVDCDLDGTRDVDQIAACFGCDVNGNGRLDICEPTGLSACEAQPAHNEGRVARLDAFGDPVAGGDRILFRATETTTNTFGLLVSTSNFASQPPMFGNGFLCLGGADLGRYSSQVGATGLDGRFDVLVDPNAVPTPAGAIALAAGTTWYFQAVYRDGSSVNLTNLIYMTFD